MEYDKKDLSFKSSVLPFQGQKINFIRKIRETIKKDFNEDNIFVDIFGGSGLISKNIKEIYPNSKVYYNDFDDFKKRVDNIKETNKILKLINDFFVSKGYKKNEKVSNSDKIELLEILENIKNDCSFFDLKTIANSILFSGVDIKEFESIKKHAFYFRNRKKLYNEDIKDYFNGIEITKLDYLENIEKWKNNKNVVFILDPPYLETNDLSYVSDKNFDFIKTLELIELIKDNNYIFFTSKKGNLLFIDDYLKNNKNIGLFPNEIKKYKTLVMSNGSSKTDKKCNYEDQMVVRNLED